MDSDPSISLGPVSSPLLWPPGIPVVAAVEWRAPELKPESEWSRNAKFSVLIQGPGPSGRTHNASSLALTELLLMGSPDPLRRVSVRVSP